MVLYIAVAGTILALSALMVFPAVGVCLTLLVRPVIDATWSQRTLDGYALTEVVGVAFPLAVLAFAVVRASGPQRFSRIPLLPLWVAYGFSVLFFCAILAGNEGIEAAANVGFRQLNGIAAYYLAQAFFRDEKSRIVFFRVLLAATLFPLGIGLYQLVTGYQWVHADTEGITRYVGMYHDAFTVRYYMLQGLLAGLVLLALRPGRVTLEKALLVVFMLCALVVMFRAYSKSAIATIVVWALLWCLLRRKFVHLGALAAACVIVAGVYLPEVREQVTQMFHKEIGAVAGSGDLNHTFAGRWYGWHELLNQWTELGTFEKIFGSHTAVGAHNDYLMMLMHGGVFGLALYALLIGAVSWRLLRNALARPDPLALAGLLAMAMWGIDAIGLVPSSYPGYQWFVWSVVGISLRVRADDRRTLRTMQKKTQQAAPEATSTAPVYG